MHWIRIIVAAVLASEALLRLPLLPAIARARRAAEKSAHLLQAARISDHWKERMLPVYALIIARNSVLFFALLCAALLPVLLAGLGSTGGLAGWLAALLQPVNILALCGISMLYMVVRARFRRG